MKVSVVSCKKCQRDIAACNVDEGYPASWYKSLGKYASSNKWSIKEIEVNGFRFDPDHKGCDICKK